MGAREDMNDDIVNNELYDAQAVAKGGIPAVALAGVPDSPPTAALVEAAAFGTEVEGSAAGAGVAEGAVSVGDALDVDAGL